MALLITSAAAAAKGPLLDEAVELGVLLARCATFCWHPLSMHIETPSKGRGGCSRMTCPPGALRNQRDAMQVDNTGLHHLCNCAIHHLSALGTVRAHFAGIPTRIAALLKSCSINL